MEKENNNYSEKRPTLSNVAIDALREAEERREAQRLAEIALEVEASKEKGGPKREPTRFADWEKNGRAIDF